MTAIHGFKPKPLWPSAQASLPQLAQRLYCAPLPLCSHPERAGLELGLRTEARAREPVPSRSPSLAPLWSQQSRAWRGILGVICDLLPVPGFCMPWGCLPRVERPSCPIFLLPRGTVALPLGLFHLLLPTEQPSVLAGDSNCNGKAIMVNWAQLKTHLAGGTEAALGS